MKAGAPNQTVTIKARTMPWLAGVFVNVVGGLLILPMISAMVSSGADAGHSWRLPVILGIVLVAAVWFCLKAASRPFRGRGDSSQPWKERFPAHTDQELQRFLQTVGESLGYRAQDWRKLGPEDDLSTLHHRWGGGDGMELVELVMAVEREYALELPEDFLTTDRKLGDLFAHITRPAASHAATLDNEQSLRNKGLP